MKKAINNVYSNCKTMKILSEGVLQGNKRTHLTKSWVISTHFTKIENLSLKVLIIPLWYKIWCRYLRMHSHENQIPYSANIQIKYKSQFSNTVGCIWYCTVLYMTFKFLQISAPMASKCKGKFQLYLSFKKYAYHRSNSPPGQLQQFWSVRRGICQRER